MRNEDQIQIKGVMSKGYGIMPKMVALDESLSIEAKAIYAFLTSFSGAGQGAFPSIETIIHYLKISENRLLKYRKELIEHGYITIQKRYIEGKRTSNLYILNTEIIPLHLQNLHLQNECIGFECIGFEGTNNNNINNNKLNNNITNIDIPYSEIIDYLNEKANTNYRSSGKKTKDLIKARYNEKFTLEDFKKVIDKKCSEWLNTKMENYLRPETLFSNKFEGYLNQKVVDYGFNKQNNSSQGQYHESYGQGLEEGIGFNIDDM